uniref:Transmembrane protein 119 n=1 Tax=Anser brachyrhynchus TaxID=132585 RepID=A0A8B9CXF2_9AVES
MDDISTEPHSALPTTTAPTSIIYKKAGDPPVLNHPGEATTAPSDSKPGGKAAEEAPAIPWDDSALMNKCLLAILLLALVAAAFMVSAPRHAAVLPDAGGSGDGDEVSAAPPARPVTPGPGPTVGDAAGTEYMLLVVVVGSLAFVLLFIICAAVIVRQKHKASAYYPSSFPKKKYVDQRDKAGGTRAFSEVPEKAPDPGAEEPLDCSRQLQADILAAAQSLKSPPKTPLANGASARGEHEKKEEEEEEKEEEGSEPAGGEHPAEPPPQNQDAAGATGPGKGAPHAAPRWCRAEVPWKPRLSPAAAHGSKNSLPALHLGR